MIGRPVQRQLIDLFVELVTDLRNKEAKRSATPTTSPHFAFTDRSEW
jgi:hypothetical protein